MKPTISKATVGFVMVSFLIFLSLAATLMEYSSYTQQLNLYDTDEVYFTNKNYVFAGDTIFYTLDNLILFLHVHLMIFIGFGFLMAHLKRYGRSTLGFTLLLSSFVIIWHIIAHGLIHKRGVIVYMDLENFIRADLGAAAFLISFGACLGKLNILQLYIMAFLETLIYVANQYLIEDVLMAHDAGGSVTLHLFGAFFGLGVCIVQGRRGGPGEDKTDLEKSSYESEIYSMIGTLFLWIFWPSFNAALVEDWQTNRAVMNTYLALVSSCIIVTTFVICDSSEKGWKFDMVYIRNATLAAGITTGSTANLRLNVYMATSLGLLGGLFSCIGYRYIQASLRKNRVHDTCGVFSLFGLPGIIGGIGGIFCITFATKKVYGNELYIIYPGMRPSGKARSRIIQALFQFASICCSMGIGLVGGLITGTFIILALPNLKEEERFTDDENWEDTENS